MTTLADKLAKPLDAGRIKSRTDGRGGSLSYLETHDVIRTANDVFGFGKWGHEVVELRQLTPVEFAKDQKQGVCVGYICTIRLTVEGCVPMSGVGYGDATEYRNTAAVTAHELAAKEAESDALKRALKNFGDQFGLALYDKAAATAGHVVTAREKLLSDLDDLADKWKALKPDYDKAELTRWLGKQPRSEGELKAAIDTVSHNIKMATSEFKTPAGVAA